MKNGIFHEGPYGFEGLNSAFGVGTPPFDTDPAVGCHTQTNNLVLKRKQ